MNIEFLFTALLSIVVPVLLAGLFIYYIVKKAVRDALNEHELSVRPSGTFGIQSEPEKS